MAPRPISSSSTRKGTTFVNPTSSSSPSVKPVTFLPWTSGLPLGLDLTQHAGGVADKRDGFAGSEESFDQTDRVLVFREIPHRAMAARIEDGVVVFLFHAVEAHSLIKLSFDVCVLLEPTGGIGLKAGVLTLGIERRVSTLWRSE